MFFFLGSTCSEMYLCDKGKRTHFIYSPYRPRHTIHIQIKNFMDGSTKGFVNMVQNIRVTVIYSQDQQEIGVIVERSSQKIQTYDSLNL